jgi:NADPH2:quinone reductase
VLRLDEVEPSPQADEALVDVSPCAVNFLDIYYRRSAFQLEPPFIPGSEATGTIVAIGTDVSQDLLCRRVAFLPIRHSTARMRSACGSRPGGSFPSATTSAMYRRHPDTTRSRTHD